MDGITEADRQAAEALRVILADISGFWFRPGDDSVLVRALARHRAEAELRLAERRLPLLADGDPRGLGARDPERRLLLPVPVPESRPLGPLAA